MSFTINESINTTLSYEEVCYIAVNIHNLKNKKWKLQQSTKQKK